MYYVLMENGILTKFSKEPSEGYVLGKVPDRYLSDFETNYQQFVWVNGGTIIPYDAVAYDQQIMREKIAEIDKDGDTSEAKISKLQEALGFSMQQTTDVINSNKDLVASDKELQKQVGFLAQEVADLKGAK